MIAALLRAWALGVVRVFYPWRAVSGRSHAPARGPVLVVANHPNGLVDPLLVRLALGQPVAFLGKSTFWQNPFFRACMEAFDGLPVYRAHEADTRQNDATFAACRDRLARGGWLALFPEGKSHDATTLQPLKTGAARIALAAAAAGAPVVVLPVGLCYADKETFRSAVAVAVGRPVPVPAGATPDDRAAVQALTAAITAALGEVVLQAEDATLWRAFLAVAAWTGATALDAREARARALSRAWSALLAADPEAAEALAEEVRAYARALAAVGVQDPFSIEAATPGPAAGSLLALVALAPLALLGAALGWLPYRAIRPLSRRLAAGHADVVGTIKLLAGSLLLPLWWAAQAAAAAALAGPAEALLVLLLGPLCGALALHWDERRVRRLDALRGIALRLFRPDTALALAQRRRELTAAVLQRLDAPRGDHAPA